MKKMSKGMLMTALICGAVYLGGSPVYASELQEFSLDEYVVTAARTETKLVDTPANISVVDAQTIEERHYQDVSEVLRDVPGANVIDNGVGASEKIIRLNGDDRVLVLVDGRRVSTDIGSTAGGRNNMDMNQLPDTNLIERIEILKGAGGALYGSEAVGGVINIITKKADSNMGKLSLAYGSMGAQDYNAMYSVKNGKTGISVAASKYEQDYFKYRDVISDRTKRWPGDSSFKNEKLSLKIDQEITSNSNLTVGYDRSKKEGTNTYDITGLYGAKLDKTNDNIYLKYNWNINNDDLGYIQVYHNEYEYNNYSYGNEGFFNEKTIGIDIQQEITMSKTNKLVIGSTWRESDVDVSGTANYNKSIENLAIFINDNWEFVPSWTLNAGIRYDDHSQAGDETTMSAGLNKKFDDNSHAYINWGQVFRAPTTDDLFHPSSGNNNLVAETGETWTVGYETNLNRSTSLGINYFESDLDDAIRWYDPNPFNDSSIHDGYFENVDKQEKRGLEFTLNHKLNDNLDLTASYTYIKVKNDKGNGYLRDWNHIPNMYRLGVNYHKGKWNANVWLRYGSGAYDTQTYYPGYTWDGVDYPSSTAGKYIDSNYLTVDATVTYCVNKDFKIFAKGYNLFNESYAEFAGTTNGSYNYPAQSRRFIVGAEYKF